MPGHEEWRRWNEVWLGLGFPTIDGGRRSGFASFRLTLTIFDGLDYMDQFVSILDVLAGQGTSPEKRRTVRAAAGQTRAWCSMHCALALVPFSTSRMSSRLSFLKEEANLKAELAEVEDNCWWLQ